MSTCISCYFIVRSYKHSFGAQEPVEGHFSLEVLGVALLEFESEPAIDFPATGLRFTVASMSTFILARYSLQGRYLVQRPLLLRVGHGFVLQVSHEAAKTVLDFAVRRFLPGTVGYLLDDASLRKDDLLGVQANQHCLLDPLVVLHE